VDIISSLEAEEMPAKLLKKEVAHGSHATGFRGGPIVTRLRSKGKTPATLRKRDRVGRLKRVQRLSDRADGEVGQKIWLAGGIMTHPNRRFWCPFYRGQSEENVGPLKGALRWERIKEGGVENRRIARRTDRNRRKGERDRSASAIEGPGCGLPPEVTQIASRLHSLAGRRGSYRFPPVRYPARNEGRLGHGQGRGVGPGGNKKKNRCC